MRLGLVVYDGLDRTSGGYLYDRTLVEGLRERGHEVRILDVPRRAYTRTLLDNLDTGLRTRLAGMEVDVLLQDELCHPSLVVHNRRLPGGRPVVAVVHHLRSSEPRPGWRQRPTRWVERAYLRTVDSFVFNSEASRRAVAALVGPVDGTVAPPGGDRFDPDLDAERIRGRAGVDGPLRLVFVGNVVPRKGLHTLVEALGHLDTTEWELTVVGDATAHPAYTGRVRRIVGATGVGDRVALVGRLPDDALAETLAESHVLAVPSTYEGYGIVYLEGMSFGLPALATTAGGASEFVTHGETGFLVPPEHPGAVATAASSLARDRDRLARMGVAARRRYEAHPTWSDTVDRVEAHLSGLVE